MVCMNIISACLVTSRLIGWKYHRRSAVVSSPRPLKAKEAAAITRQLKADNRLVALDVAGEIISTEKLASRFQQWQMEPQPLTIIIGGPDGLSDGLLSQADQCWSLGRITLPHPLVRVILAEQLYRAWSINANHPYHRA